MKDATERDLGPLDAEAARALLVEGNRRFAEAASHHPHQSPEWRRSLLGGQKPFAAVLTCSDSRVSPEIIFDRGLGDLFVIRSAGHVLDDAGIASLEYAVDHLHVPLVLVLGHSNCGAVCAAASTDQHELPGRLPLLTRALQPAWEEARRTRATAGGRDEQGDAGRAARMHARMTAMALPSSSPLLTAKGAKREPKILPAYYELASGIVEWLPWQ